jgi:hypothetical protein
MEHVLLQQLKSKRVMWAIVEDDESEYDGCVGRAIPQGKDQTLMTFNHTTEDIIQNESLWFVDVDGSEGVASCGDSVMVIGQEDGWDDSKLDCYGFIGEVHEIVDEGKLVHFGGGEMEIFPDSCLMVVGFRDHRRMLAMKKADEEKHPVAPQERKLKCKWPEPSRDHPDVIPVEDVRRLDIKPGDAILVKLPPMPKDIQGVYARAADKAFKDIFPDTKVIVIGHGVDVSVIREDVEEVDDG